MQLRYSLLTVLAIVTGVSVVMALWRAMGPDFLVVVVCAYCLTPLCAYCFTRRGRRLVTTGISMCILLLCAWLAINVGFLFSENFPRIPFWNVAAGSVAVWSAEILLWSILARLADYGDMRSVDTDEQLVDVPRLLNGEADRQQRIGRQGSASPNRLEQGATTPPLKN